ncbi:hypothetical protein [Pseudomonas avellanae]|uniref:hypothetical protein n=1 Tax=Pseudomonas avellanae TaxID=46257 RepID=UPI00040DD1D3|nr:hypothetical protein [Pseudomonas avellanae]
MARLTKQLDRIQQNIARAKARFLVIGTLVVMMTIVIFGTALVLRSSYAPLARQYQQGIQKTLKRVVSEFDSIDGKIAFRNMTRPSPDERGIPVTQLPLDYLNFLPGHIEEMKPLAACSYASTRQPDVEACAAVLESRTAGDVLYIQGVFKFSGDFISPIYTKSPTTGHHLLVSLEARGLKKNFIITFDPVRRPVPTNKPAFSPAWSVTGFRMLSDGQSAYAREQDIRGRVLPVDVEDSTYRYIIQIPIQSFSDATSWPPSDLSDVRVNINLAPPNPTSAQDFIAHTTDMAAVPKFSFHSMAEYLSPGEKLRFIPPTVIGGEEIEIEAASPSIDTSHRSRGRTLLDQVSNVLIRMIIPNIATQKTYIFPEGGSIELNGNASLVLAGWRVAAQAIISFAIVLCACLVVAGIILHNFLLVPLNNVRRNTLYLKGRFSDVETFKPPHAISNKLDEIGVLWESIKDLHKSITSYGREALERSQKQTDMLRALGHEIKSPLQDLTIRHGNPLDPSFKSIKRITHALKIFSDSSPESDKSRGDSDIGPEEAIRSSDGDITRENISEYLAKCNGTKFRGNV